MTHGDTSKVEQIIVPTDQPGADGATTQVVDNRETDAKAGDNAPDGERAAD